MANRRTGKCRNQGIHPFSAERSTCAPLTLDHMSSKRLEEQKEPKWRSVTLSGFGSVNTGAFSERRVLLQTWFNGGLIINGDGINLNSKQLVLRGNLAFTERLFRQSAVIYRSLNRNRPQWLFIYLFIYLLSANGMVRGAASRSAD